MGIGPLGAQRLCLEPDEDGLGLKLDAELVEHALLDLAF